MVHQLEGERNFHILYQLIRGIASEDKSSEYYLSSDPESYVYLSQSSVSTLPHISDSEVFKLTCDCMQSVGIEKETQSLLNQLLAGILHLGNVSYDIDTGEDHIVTGVSSKTIQHHLTASKLFEVDSEEFLTAIVKRNMHVSGSVIVKTQKLEQVRFIFRHNYYFML